LYRLCLAGHAPHPNYLRKLLNSEEIAGWQAFARIEPFDQEYRELLNGLVCASGSDAQPTDFMPSRWGLPTEEELHAKLMSIYH
jgi:hypothetical protein